MNATRSLLRLTLACAGLLALAARAQPYSMDWFKVSGGGGSSTGGVYDLTATIGQHDAGMSMAGGRYSLTGGFWSLLAVIQTPGVPNLTVGSSGNNVTVSWPDTGDYTLQQNGDLAVPGGWTASGYSITTANGTNSITIAFPTGNLFFRLRQP